MRACIFLLICVGLGHVVDGMIYQSYCSLKNRPIVLLAQDPLTGEFVIGDQNIAASSNGFGDETGAGIVASQTGENTSDWKQFSARRCYCASDSDLADTYCLSTFTHCAVPTNPNNVSSILGDLGPPECVIINRSQRFVRSVFPLILIWFGSLAGCVLGTKVGRHVLDYVVSCCFPRWTKYVADRMMRQEPSRARRLIRRNWRERRRLLVRLQQDSSEVAAEQGSETVTASRGMAQLALRTRIYHEPEEGLAVVKTRETEDEDDRACTICFGPIEDGDKVGALPCDHIFHSECLKTWLVRRQVCPLCQRSDVVERRYNQGGEEGAETSAPNADDNDIHGEHQEVLPFRIENET